MEYIKKAVSAITEGEIIVFPTDTVYGVAASPYNDEALKKLYKAKNRDYSSAIIALISDVEDIKKVAEIKPELEEKLKRLSNTFWPGALSIILKKHPSVSDIMTGGKDTVGIRIPKNDIALEIIKKSGGVLAVTSANLSGEKSPLSYDDLSDEFLNRVHLAIDGGICELGIESSILDLSTEKARILRHGGIKKEDIEKIIGEVE